MERIGVLVVSYGAREAAMVDALARSQKYKVELYIADKQLNPFNVEKAAKHVVIPNLNIQDISKFAQSYKDKIDFVLKNQLLMALEILLRSKLVFLLFVQRKNTPLKRAKLSSAYFFKRLRQKQTHASKSLTLQTTQAKMKSKKTSTAGWMS
jgi:phosphoribosylamine-glycine ligase